ncbi:flagellar protein FlgN [Lentibacillus sp. N15]|uniref:flagellar protein FlgN n=1 Tax=Lentibacillus songyuanensis TaxID=3136161 RepID=UPI0031BAD5BC
MLSVQQMIQAIEKLLTIHKSLLRISTEKTTIVKNGDTEQLQPLLMKERRHIQALEQTEAFRQQTVTDWAAKSGFQQQSVTITDILEQLPDEQDKEQLADVTTELTNVVTALKRQEQLNRVLIQQSLQFVDISLDMINPSLKKLNYGQAQLIDTDKQSVFDSKA